MVQSVTRAPRSAAFATCSWHTTCKLSSSVPITKGRKKEASWCICKGGGEKRGEAWRRADTAALDPGAGGDGLGGRRTSRRRCHAHRPRDNVPFSVRKTSTGQRGTCRPRYPAPPRLHSRTPCAYRSTVRRRTSLFLFLFLFVHPSSIKGRVVGRDGPRAHRGRFKLGTSACKHGLTTYLLAGSCAVRAPADQE